MRRRRLEASAQSPMEISPITMVEEETFFRGHGKLPDCPGSESPASVPSQGTLTEEPDRDPEKWYVSFRTFSGSEESDPIQDLRRLRELCRLWLRPDLHTKEQIMDKLVLEQFMTCMPLGCQVLVRESGVESCRDLEDLLRENRKPKKWTVVHIRGKNFLVRDPEVQRAEAGVSDTDDERKLFREPQSPMNGVRPENGQQEEKALQPETTPESADLEGLTPKRNVEEDMLEDRKEAGALQAQPELQEGPDSGTAQGGKDAQEGMDLQVGMWPPTCLPEREVSTRSAHRGGSRRSLRRYKQKRANSPACPDVRQEGAPSVDTGEVSGQLGSRSVRAPSTVGPRSRPEGDAAPARTPYECRVCKKRFRYESQFTLHQRTHTRERPFRCNVCAKGFMQPSDLRVHQRVHTGEKPHCCDLCPKRFAHDSTLRAHKRVHTREKPFQCEHCDKAFSHRGNLNVHRRTHSGLKPYVCPECHGAFRQLGTFKRHQKTHFRMTRQ
ncbi:zinc finger and SCAN domain-containing protein 5B-like [Camelus ferus]|uniref:Zinc finger and SCAN domain-containing protein 5B-like n=2 Tax=Camelus TaxID=9836 RepID=A0A8B8TMK6_CAMFR|nr:zinc finger and SCAN domain-containing protein 5B-like [Camelus ferus]